MSDIKVHIEIGKNLASVINNVIDNTNTTDQIDAVMNTLKEMYLGQKVFKCGLCGGYHYVGDPCNIRGEDE